MRKIEKFKFPVNEAVILLREKCFEYCTLADKDDQLYLQKSIQKKNDNINIVISPIVSIYVTTVMEHIAEYLLTAMAISAEHEGTDYVRVKEVYLALLDDVQLGNIFGRMKLKERMERTMLPNKNRASYFPSQLPTINNNHRKSYFSTHNNNNNNNNQPEIDLDEDLDLDYFDENIRKSQSSTSTSVRPHSVMSHHSNTSRKSTFHVFKNNRNSFSNFDTPSRSSSPVASIYDPDNIPTMNFDELVKSGGTVKVSLTPNRLRSIEVKDQTKEDVPVPELTWERRSMSSPRLPSPNLSRQASKKSTLSTVSQKERPIDAKLMPKSPASPLATKSFTMNEHQFENPREAPKPPSTIEIAPPKKPLTPLSIVSSISNTLKSPKTSEFTQKISFGVISSSTEMSLPSSTSTDSAPSVPAPPSVISLPPIENKPKEPMMTVQESQTPKLSNIMIRRGSLSNRKSRENLRKKKSIEHTQELENKQVQFMESKQPERPSSMVAKRVSMVGNIRQRAMYENFPAEPQLQQEPRSVSVSIKQWDLKSEENVSSSPRSTRRQESLEQVPENTSRGSNAVLDKVLKFERASSLDAVAHQKVSNLPRRERFLYLQQDPSAIERKSTIRTNSRPKGIDQGVQTEYTKKEEEEGLVDGDEEWFLQDDEWDEQEETAMVEWLLGE
ncbi:unnamed protein product [Rhizopus stolonifer]